MKSITTLLAACLLSGGLDAQITITQADFSRWSPGTDTFRELTAAPGLGAGASWDLSSAVYDPKTFNLGYVVYGRSPFPFATFSYEADHQLSELSYSTTVVAQIAPSGITELGEDVGRQGIDISQYTGTADDSVFFDPEIIRYSSPRTVLQFPATPGARWSSDFFYATNFLLKAIDFSPAPFACVRTTYVKQQDTIAGWGRIRIRRTGGDVSDWMDVLAVQTAIRSHDSFYLSGAPAPELILAFFGLRQEQPDSSYTIRYYRRGEVRPLLHVEYADSTFTRTSYARVQQSRIPAQPMSIPASPAAHRIRIYPNPAMAASGFNIELTETTPGIWSYILLDATGKQIAASGLRSTDGKTHIDAQAASPGTYILSVTKDGRQVAARPVVIGR